MRATRLTTRPSLRATLALPLLLAACGRADDAPGATSAGEAQSLNEAAAMLDANSVDLNSLDLEGDNQEQPE
jgi:hypothetical protein